VTLRTLNGGMRTSEWKSSGIVVEGCPSPRSRGVTGVASRGESALRVVGVGGSLIVLHVAGRAGPGVQSVVAVHVAL
jgi:hypothetical protein